MRDTVVVNAFGGPGSGKTTACFYVACELKKKGYVVEYVPEYSKELVWDENWDLLDGSYEHQRQILAEQKRRIDRLVGKVDFVVTDAPILFNIIYLNDCDEKKQHMQDLLKIFGGYTNFNFFVQRDEENFEKEGRIQNLDESKKKDEEILNLLRNNGLFCGQYSHKNLKYLIQNAITTKNRVARKKAKSES